METRSISETYLSVNCKPGRYKVLESGLSYYGLRYYDAGLGRWTQRDPIGERGGKNLYGFVGNEPVGRIDPFGKKAYLVYRPFASKYLKFFYPLVGHYYLAFDSNFSKSSHAAKADWSSVVQSMGISYIDIITFSFHPLAVRASVLKDVPTNAGVQVSTFVTQGSFVDINNQVDIDGYHRAGKWFGLGKGRTDTLTDDFCRQVYLFKQAVESAKKNNGGSPDPGNYQVLNQNCGTWAQLMIKRAKMNYPMHEAVIGNAGGGIGGLSDLSRVGDVTTETLRSIYDAVEWIKSKL